MCVEPKELTIKGLVWVVIGTVDISQVMITVLLYWGFVYLNGSYDFVEEDEDHDDPD